jgi:hypothetical protein
MRAPCSAFGLGIRSDVEIAALRRAPSARTADLSIELHSVPDDPQSLDESGWTEFHRSQHTDEYGTPAVRAARHARLHLHRLRYADGTTVFVDEAGTRIWSAAPERATVEDTATYLLGPAMGFVLRLRGLLCLHASAAVAGGRAVAMIGRSGAGKSTMAASFALRGDAVITDDVLAIAETNGGYEVHPAYPRVRLWPESVQGLFGHADALPRITPGWDKRHLDLTASGFRFQTQTLPLSAIYLLDDLSSPQAPWIEPMRPRDAFLAVLANTYASEFLDSPRRAAEFDAVMRLTQHVPVRRAWRHFSFDSLEPLCAAIESDAAAVSTA